VRAEPLEWAEEISNRMVDVVRIKDRARLLDADPALAGAINTVLVKKGARVNKLRKETTASQLVSWSHAAIHSDEEEEVISVVKISIEVCNRAASFDIAVQAQSIQQAMGFVRRRYPNADVRVRFPIDPEGFLVKDPAARAGLIEGAPPQLTAAWGNQWAASS
jgi:hypothetical protein